MRNSQPLPRASSSDRQPGRQSTGRDWSSQDSLPGGTAVDSGNHRVTIATKAGHVNYENYACILAASLERGLRGTGIVQITPCTVKAALKYVRQWHRHLPVLQGGLFAASLTDGMEVVAVAVAGNPPPEWNGTGRICITRVAVSNSVPVRENACSRLYGALCRAAKALGWSEAWTYTLRGEPGTSLVASGFQSRGWTSGGTWNSPSKPRKIPVEPGPKQRWMRRL